MWGAISKSLSLAPNLDMLLVWDHKQELSRVPRYMRTVAANPSLKHIRLEPSMSPQGRRISHQIFFNEVEQDTKLKVLFDLVDKK
jgi:hypothetical protein